MPPIPPLFNLSHTPSPEEPDPFPWCAIAVYQESPACSRVTFKLQIQSSKGGKNTALSQISRVNSFQPQHPQKANSGLRLHSCWPAHCLQSCRDLMLGCELSTPLKKKHLDMVCWTLVVVQCSSGKKSPLSIPYLSPLP